MKMEWTHRRRFNRRYDLLVDVEVAQQIVAPNGKELLVYLKPVNPRLVRRRGRWRKAV